MMRKIRTEITIETDRIVLISERRAHELAWCDSCFRQVANVTVDQAAKLARVSSRTVYQWVEGDKVHSFETADGRLLVCLDSVPPPI